MGLLSVVRTRSSRLGVLPDAYRHVVTLLDGSELDLRERRGFPTLIVNTASRDAYTGQFTGLQALHERFRARGLWVLACPSGDFGGAEFDDPAEIRDFLEENYQIDFPVLQPSSVRFEPTRLWADLAAQPTAGPPVWNFTKYLVGGDGKVIDWWSTNVRPTSPRIVGAISAAVAR